jgi:hypothetical protein
MSLIPKRLGSDAHFGEGQRASWQANALQLAIGEKDASFSPRV